MVHGPHILFYVVVHPVVGLSLLCSENCLLCFLALLQFCAYCTRLYATPQSIMLVVIEFNISSCYNHFSGV